MGDHKLRLGHVHGWNLSPGADDVVVDYFATHDVSRVDWKDELWLLEDVVEKTNVTVMCGGGYGRTLACHPSH